MPDNSGPPVANVVAYINLLEEIKLRIEAIDAVITGETRLRAKIAEEHCYLQLRMICELIAIGCLVIHGDIPATQSNRVQKAFLADWIMNALSSLHPGFYPVPMEAKDAPGDPPESRDIKSGFLSKEELIKLYHQCGKVLHRGNLKNILAKGLKEPDLRLIVSYRGKLFKLLNRHRIIMSDPEWECWIGMQHTSTGRVHFGIMKRTGKINALV